MKRIHFLVGVTLAVGVVLCMLSSGMLSAQDNLKNGTSGLPVTCEEEILVYCRGFGVFGACAARLYSASVSAIISVRASCPGCSMMLITS
jgi:hypothetical protein